MNALDLDWIGLEICRLVVVLTRSRWLAGWLAGWLTATVVVLVVITVLLELRTSSYNQ